MAAEPVTVTLDDLLALKKAGTLNDVLLEEQPAGFVKSSMKRAYLTHHADHTRGASDVDALSLTKKALTVIDKALALEQVAAHKFGNYLDSCGCVLCLVLAAIMASCPGCLAQAGNQKSRGKCNCGLWWKWAKFGRVKKKAFIIQAHAERHLNPEDLRAQADVNIFMYLYRYDYIHVYIYIYIHVYKKS